MDTYKDIKENGKATISANQVSFGQTLQSGEISSEPLKRYITELREELRTEMAGISDIKW